MTQQQLFEDGPAIELSPGQINRRDALRLSWVRRQRRSRANRRLRERVAANRHNKPRQVPISDWLDTCTREEEERFIVGLMRILDAMMMGGEIATLAFERLESEHLPEPYSFVFEAARTLHQRRQRVTGAAIKRELKLQGIVPMLNLDAMDKLKREPHMAPETVERNAQALREMTTKWREAA